MITNLYEIEPGYPLQMLMWERRYFPMRNGIRQIVVKCWRNIGVTV